MRASHFLMKLIFCMFGEHIGLLPGQVFSRTIEAKKANPPSLSLPLKSLFGAMSKGGSFRPGHDSAFQRRVVRRRGRDYLDARRGEYARRNLQVRLVQYRADHLRNSFRANP